MNDLRVGFKERHRKLLYEAIDMVIPQPKKAYPKRTQEEQTKGVPPVVVPQPNVAGPSSAPVTEKEA